jgi:hypothetical protein
MRCSRHPFFIPLRTPPTTADILYQDNFRFVRMGLEGTFSAYFELCRYRAGCRAFAEAILNSNGHALFNINFALGRLGCGILDRCTPAEEDRHHQVGSNVFTYIHHTAKLRSARHAPRATRHAPHATRHTRHQAGWQITRNSIEQAFIDTIGSTFKSSLPHLKPLLTTSKYFQLLPTTDSHGFVLVILL